MSGICGIVNFDGAPIGRVSLEKMTGAAASRGQDGIHYWIHDNVGLAHLALHTTQEAGRETQPIVVRGGDIVLVADARVDNWEDLTRTLTAKGYLLEKASTDADLILAAYVCWGEDCPKHIVGDFAFAVWDGSKQSLFCARDPVGIRSLFYCWRDQTLYFATTISSILAVLSSSPSLNDYLITDFLCWRFDRWVDETVYQGISRLLASYSYIAESKGGRLVRYWMLGAKSAPRYKTDTEYLEHFRELFRMAVFRRLRSATPVGISLSGGLDSSSIAGMANHIYEDDNRSPFPDVRLYSCAFENFSRADERQYMQAVHDQCRYFPATVIDGKRIWGLKDVDIGENFRLDEPEIFSISYMLVEVLNKARQHGCRVVLTGEGGDQVLSDGAYWNPNLLPDVGIRRIAAEFRYFWMRSRWATFRFLPSLVTSAIKPLIPVGLLKHRRLTHRIRSAPAWVSKEWLTRFESEAIDRTSDTVLHLPNRSSVLMYRQLTGGWYAALLSYLNGLSGRVGIEYRLPFLDRELIDFMLVIPARFRFADGTMKIMLRKALPGILAETVRHRTMRAHFSQVVDYGIRQKERTKVESLLSGIHNNQGKYLGDVEKLELAWRSYYRGDDPPSFVLLAPVMLQNWLAGLS